MLTGAHSRAARMLAISGLAIALVCAVRQSDSASFSRADWQQVKTGAQPHVIELIGGSYIEITPRSSANVSFIQAQPSVHLSAGRLNANLIAGAGTTGRFSAPQVFIRASEGHFFMVNDRGRTTIGVCRGTITGLAGKRDQGANKGISDSGEFSIVPGEQAIISGDGTIMKEQDESMDCVS